MPGAAPPVTRYDYLDGIRGLAALYVCLHHAYLEIAVHGLYSEVHWRIVRWSERLLNHGHCAVDLFIVLSGFCLMLPSVSTGRLRGGLGSYLYRRARRILPPYYASLFVTFALIALFPRLGQLTGLRWDVLLPVYDTGVLVSHAFLVHNFWDSWAGKIQGTASSVATEWQIYFLFPLLLIVWRKAGNWGTTLLSIAVGIAAACLIPDRINVGSCPWYIGLFALGMAAASMAPGPARKDGEGAATGGLRILGVGVAWMALGIVGLYVINHHNLARGPVLRTIFRDPSIGFSWHYDLASGLIAAGFLLTCRWLHGRPRTGWNPLRLLESGALVTLGVFSYSLYLTHYPILAALHVFVHGQGLSPVAELVFIFLVATPIAVAAAYLFYLVVERRFAPTAHRKPREIDQVGPQPRPGDA